jgi:hypothetical protein
MCGTYYLQNLKMPSGIYQEYRSRSSHSHLASRPFGSHSKKALKPYRAVELYTYGKRRYGTLRKDASSGSKLLGHVMRPESRSARLRTNGIHFLSLFQQIAGRDASTSGVDADLRRVSYRALTGSANQYKPSRRGLFLINYIQHGFKTFSSVSCGA